MLRYGKPSAPLLRHKSRFLEENEELAAAARKLCAVYAMQPSRTRCKICDARLGPPAFEKLGVEYVLCDRCGHLNGAHEDTDAFCRAVYTDDGGAAYAANYAAADREAFGARVDDIYVPKAQFLVEALTEAGEAPRDLTYADFGAGTGYFVAALTKAGLERAIGYEVSAAQVARGNAMLGAEMLICHDLDETVKIAADTEADVVSMIGVLEHLQNPREVLASLVANGRVRYVFLSAPLFSPCVFLEMAFPGVFHRQLSGGHTHLFTDESLNWMCRAYQLERISEWWFGTDVVDLYRTVRVSIETQGASERTRAHWTNQMLPALDQMQRALDEQHSASEVHVLLRKTPA